MKIAIAASGPALEDQVSAEFDQSRYLVIVDTRTMAHEAIVSPMRVAEGPMAGELLARALSDAQVSKVLANHIEVDVLRGLLAVADGKGIQILDGMQGSVRSVARKFREMCMADTVVVSSPYRAE